MLAAALDVAPCPSLVGTDVPVKELDAHACCNAATSASADELASEASTPEAPNFDSANDAHSELVRTVLQGVRMCRQCRDFINAEELLLSMLKTCPVDPDLLIAYGLFMLEVEKKVLISMSYFEEVLALYPAHPDALTALAWIYTTYLKDNAKADELLRQMKSLPSACPMLWRLGEISWRGRHDRKSAIFFYELAIASDATDPLASASYASLLALDQSAGAERLFQHSLQHDAHNNRTHHDYGIFLLQSGRSELAEMHFRQAASLAPMDPDHPFELAKLLHPVKDRCAEATTLYETAITLSSGGDVARLAMLNCAVLLHENVLNIDRAEELYKAVLQTSPLSMPTLSQYAVLLHVHRQQYSTAEKLYNQALSIDPSNATALHGYAVMMHLVRRNYSTAKLLYERAIQANPQDAECISHFAILLVSMKDMANAERHFLSAMNVDQGSKVHYLNYVNFRQLRAKAALQWAGSVLISQAQAKYLPTSVTLHLDLTSTALLHSDSEMNASEAEDRHQRDSNSQQPANSECASPPPREMVTPSVSLLQEADMTPWMSSIHAPDSGQLGSMDTCEGSGTDLEALFDSLPMMIPC